MLEAREDFLQSQLVGSPEQKVLLNPSMLIFTAIVLRGFMMCLLEQTRTQKRSKRYGP